MSVRLSVRHTPVFCLNGYTYPRSFYHRRVAPSLVFFISNGSSLPNLKKNKYGWTKNMADIRISRIFSWISYSCIRASSRAAGTPPPQCNTASDANDSSGDSITRVLVCSSVQYRTYCSEMLPSGRTANRSAEKSVSSPSLRTIACQLDFSSSPLSAIAYRADANPEWQRDR